MRYTYFNNTGFTTQAKDERGETDLAEMIMFNAMKESSSNYECNMYKRRGIHPIWLLVGCTSCVPYLNRTLVETCLLIMLLLS